MKGKSTFTQLEAKQIIALIRQKIIAKPADQKKIRDNIRKLSFYASDFRIGGGYTEKDFLRVVSITGEMKTTSSRLIAVKKPLAKEPVLDNTNRSVGLAPVVDKHTRILILGTMPGIESLKQQAYYSHPRNLFWKLMGILTKASVPGDPVAKKKFLLAQGIGLWDVCKTCIRKGSLDQHISEETPNDVRGILKKYPGVKAIAFNGAKAYSLFVKHFGSVHEIKVYELPSTSPANASISLDHKTKQWEKIKASLQRQ